jgi:hypothetical protein
MKKFNEQPEGITMDFLVRAHNAFCLIEDHKKDSEHWLHHMRALQALLLARVTIREYSEEFQ